MKNRARFGNIGWAFLLLVFLLGACSTTPPVAYYTLNTLPEMQQEIPAAVMDDTLGIGVGPVEFPKFLDRPQQRERSGTTPQRKPLIQRCCGY